MIKNWELFEKNALLFLRDNIKGDDKLKFQESGNSNSRETDIKVIYNHKKMFSIEVKKLPAQCGQFVVEFNDGKFCESSKNFSKNKYSNSIIEELNNTTSVNSKISSVLELRLTQNLMFNWIKEHYTNKDVKYFIVSNQINSEFNLIDINELNEFLKFSCVLRRKRSGSRDVSKSKRWESLSSLETHLNKENNSIVQKKVIGKSFIVTTLKKVENKYFHNNSYFLSEINNQEYKIKQLSSTNNPSIIFSVDYSKKPKNNGISNFGFFT